MLWVVDENDDNDGIEQWYFGRVEKIVQENDCVKADVKWEEGGEITTEKLDESKWAGPNASLVEFSWMLA